MKTENDSGKIFRGGGGGLSIFARKILRKILLSGEPPSPDDERFRICLQNFSKILCIAKF